jgi:Co/Zn/Cd efflux system component
MECHGRKFEVTFMSASCCGPKSDPNNSPAWRAALWVALVVNAAMFGVELYAGATADSHALLADALDFFGDAANYAISLLVAGLAIAWRARAALFKGATLVVLGLYVLGSSAAAAIYGATPEPRTMGIIGILALAANVAVALMLFRFRSGDANMRSVWICSRNDAIGNVAVVAAAAGVFGTGTAWPDLIVAAILALLGLTGGWQIIAQARGELRHVRTPPAMATAGRSKAVLRSD